MTDAHPTSEPPTSHRAAQTDKASDSVQARRDREVPLTPAEKLGRSTSRASLDSGDEGSNDFNRAQRDAIRQYVEDFLVESDKNPGSRSTTPTVGRGVAAVPPDALVAHIAHQLAAAGNGNSASASLTLRRQSSDDDEPEEGSGHSQWGAVPVPSSCLSKSSASVLSPFLHSQEQSRHSDARTSTSDSRTGRGSAAVNGAEETDEYPPDSPYSMQSGTRSYVPCNLLGSLEQRQQSPAQGPAVTVVVDQPRSVANMANLPEAMTGSRLPNTSDGVTPGRHAPPLNGFQPLQEHGGARQRGNPAHAQPQKPPSQYPCPPEPLVPVGETRYHLQPATDAATTPTSKPWQLPLLPVPLQPWRTSPRHASASSPPQLREGEDESDTQSAGVWEAAVHAEGSAMVRTASTPAQLRCSAQSPPPHHTRTGGAVSRPAVSATNCDPSPAAFAPVTQTASFSQALDQASISASSSHIQSVPAWPLRATSHTDIGDRTPSAGKGGSSSVMERCSTHNSLLTSLDAHGTSISVSGVGGLSGQSFALGSGIYPDASFLSYNPNSLSPTHASVGHMDGSGNHVFTPTPVAVSTSAGSPGFAIRPVCTQPSYADPQAPYTSHGMKPFYTLNHAALGGATPTRLSFSSEEINLWNGERGVVNVVPTLDTRSVQSQGTASVSSARRGSLSSNGGGYQLSPSSATSSLAVYTTPIPGGVPQLYVLPPSVTASIQGGNYGDTTPPPSQPQNQHHLLSLQPPFSVSPPQPLSAAALQAALMSCPSPNLQGVSTGSPLLILGDASNPNVPRKTANVHGALAGVLRYISYEDDGAMDANGNLNAFTLVSVGAGSANEAAPRGCLTLAPTTVIATQWGAQHAAAAAAQHTSHTATGPSRSHAHLGSGLQNQTFVAAMATSTPPVPIACVPTAPLQGAPTAPIFIQMFPCELRDRVRVLNTVMSKVSTLAHLPQTVGLTISVEPRSETSFIAKVRTPAVWRLLYLLRCRVLMDRHGFWYAETMDQYMQLKEYCEDVRRLPQQTRHYQTDGLPCMPLVVEISRSADRHSASSTPDDHAPPHPAFVPFDQLLPMASVDRHRTKLPPQSKQPLSLPQAKSPTTVAGHHLPTPLGHGGANSHYTLTTVSPSGGSSLTATASTSPFTACTQRGSACGLTSDYSWSVTPTSITSGGDRSSADAGAPAIPSTTGLPTHRTSSVSLNAGAWGPVAPRQASFASFAIDSPHGSAGALQANSPNAFAGHGETVGLEKSTVSPSPLYPTFAPASGGHAQSNSSPHAQGNSHFHIVACGGQPGLGRGAGAFGCPAYTLCPPEPASAPPQGPYA